LGLQAQQAAARFAEAEGYHLIQAFEEIETGKGSDALGRRPQTLAALRAALQPKTWIVVAKVDRFSRDVHFIGPITHRTPFIVAELGADAVPFMLNLCAALAEKGAICGEEGAGSEAGWSQCQGHPEPHPMQRPEPRSLSDFSLRAYLHVPSQLY
jgi:hypothetical protein